MKKKFGYTLSLPVAVALVFATAAWARTYTFHATPVAPGATGVIDAKAPKAGGNTDLTIKVDHLARPTLLTPPANQYVVWIQPENGQPQNEGVLSVGDNEKGDLKITTSASKFAVLVTAENEAHAQSPSGRVVLRADVLE
jgi:hypothetical protein